MTIEWDDPDAEHDPDELKPTVKVRRFPKMSFEERLAYDERVLELNLIYGTGDAA